MQQQCMKWNEKKYHLENKTKKLKYHANIYYCTVAQKHGLSRQKPLRSFIYHINASPPNHHVHDFTLMLIHKSLKAKTNK